jgi:hypothetical protein
MHARKHLPSEGAWLVSIPHTDTSSLLIIHDFRSNMFGCSLFSQGMIPRMKMPSSYTSYPTQSSGLLMDNQYATGIHNNSLTHSLAVCSLLHWEWEGNQCNCMRTYLPVVDKELSKPIHGAGCWGRRHIHPSKWSMHLLLLDLTNWIICAASPLRLSGLPCRTGKLATCTCTF